MNLTYGDTNLSVRYLEAFLQNEYDGTLRVSGIYDTYTHNNLIDYINLPPVLDSNSMYAKLMDTYDEFKLFVVSRNTTKIIFHSKATSANQALEEAMLSLQKTLFEFVKGYGWSVTSFISSGKSKDLYKIELTQDTRKNLIPSDAASLINLSTENFIFDATVLNTQIVSDTPDKYVKLTSEPSDWEDNYTSYYVFNSSTGEYEANSTSTFEGGIFFEKISKSCCMIVECEPNTEYVVVHRIDNADPNDTTKQLQVRIVVATSEVATPNMKENSSVVNSEVFRLYRGDCSTPYTTTANAKKLVISYPYDQSTYNKSILVFKKPTYLNDDFIDTKEFVESYWTVNSKYLDYLFGSVITEYTDEEDIFYAQKLLQSVCKNYVIDMPGVYSESFRSMVYKYQMLDLKDDIHYPISYALGYIDVETEARLIKDVDRGFMTIL